MKIKKVAIAPCTGLDQPLGTVARIAGYKVLDTLRPDKTVLLCPPALIAGVEEDVIFAKENPVLVIDGCKKNCLKTIVQKWGGKVVSVINVEEIQRKHGNLTPLSKRVLGSNGEKLVELVAEEAAKEVDQILRYKKGE